MTTFVRSTRHETGQAMVEFVIILIFIMAMCAGMISSIRLLGFQFWAQQEARYIAFEQTWAPHDFYGSQTDPINKLDDGAFFGRPRTVSERDAEKNVSDDGALPELLSWLKPMATERAKSRRIEELVEAPMMMAKAAWWKGKSSEWFEENGAVDRAFNFVGNAIASTDYVTSVRSEGAIHEIAPKNPFEVNELAYQDRLQGPIREYLTSAGVGPKVCESLSRFSRQNGRPHFLAPFEASDCASKIEEGLSWNLSHQVDVQEFVRGYGETIENGFTPAEAIEKTVRLEVAQGFYSLYDSFVDIAQDLAVPLMVAERIDIGSDLASNSVTKLVTDSRYLGSAVAITAILGEGVNIGLRSPSNRSSQSVLNFENSVIQILHLDVGVGLGDIVTPFALGPQYLPVPPSFGDAAAGLQEAVMKNLLSDSDDSALRGPEIENANKFVEVSYRSQGGMFNLATNNIRGVEDARLTARFYLVTQPWHMKRRKDGTGEYREKGTEFDDDSEETEEAIMRRRVFGLFLFPDSPSAFLEPIADILGLGDELEGAFELVNQLESVLGFVKDLVFDNPFTDILLALSEIPVLGSIVPVPPKFPAVRPDAYPRSKEMTGNAMDNKDKLMGSERDFSDYVDEQRNHNPAPEPTFN